MQPRLRDSSRAAKEYNSPRHENYAPLYFIDMKASELIRTLQEMVEEYGDLDVMNLNDGGVSDITMVEYLETEPLVPIFVIS